MAMQSEDARARRAGSGRAETDEELPSSPPLAATTTTSARLHTDNNNNNNDDDGAVVVVAASDALLRSNRRWARLGYFMLYAGFAGTSPFYSVLLAQRGLGTVEVGYVASLMPLSTLLVLPPVSYLTDRYGCATLVQMLAVAGSAAALLVVTVPAADVTLPTLTVALVMLVHFVTRCPLTPFYDQHTRALLPASRKAEWGGMRCFGSYGWGVCAPVLSQLIAMYGWWVAGASYVCGALACLFAYTRIRLPANAQHHGDGDSNGSSGDSTATTHARPPRFLDVFAYVYAHPRIAVFLLAECLMGLGYSVIGTYLFLFLTSLGAPQLLLGLSVTMTVVVETPLFQFSRYLHAAFSDRQLLVTSMLSWSLRVTCYSLLTRPWLVLLLEPLHGMTFGLMWISGVHFVNAAFPPALSHTANGLLSSAAFGVGPIIGNIAGGLLYHGLGARIMFRVMAAGMAVLGVLYALVDRHLEARGEDVGVDKTNTQGDAPPSQATQGNDHDA